METAIYPERIPTGVLGTDNDDDIFITDAAIESIRKIREENNVPSDMRLRLGTRGGGCSGMNYVIGFDTTINENDREFRIRDLDILVDSKSLFYMMGVTLDYVSDETGSGFLFNNPYNEKVCGCSH